VVAKEKAEHAERGGEHRQSIVLHDLQLDAVQQHN
jgi:hypothetical protein